MRRRHHERHSLADLGWLRAGVLGANDGIVSTASLILGVAAAHAQRHGVIVSGTAGLVAGALSMAIGEYVSVHSQADTEHAALAQERAELADDYAGERNELTEIYVRRGVQRDLAARVAEQLMAHDALGAHAQDELQLSPVQRARPLQAALASAASFALGAGVPLLVVMLAPDAHLETTVVCASLLALFVLGGVSAKVGAAPVWIGACRVAGWSALAMAATAAVGRLFGGSP